jgi:hypothetical protein
VEHAIAPHAGVVFHADYAKDSDEERMALEMMMREAEIIHEQAEWGCAITCGEGEGLARVVKSSRQTSLTSPMIEVNAAPTPSRPEGLTDEVAPFCPRLRPRSSLLILCIHCFVCKNYL